MRPRGRAAPRPGPIQLSPAARIDVFNPRTRRRRRSGPRILRLRSSMRTIVLAVVDKPAGLSVHPGAGRVSGTLVSALLFRGMSLSEKSGADRPGIVHRLDKDTSGLIVVAKDDRAYDGLKSQFMAHTVGRLYRGVCWGRIGQDPGAIETLIARHGRDRTRMTTRTAAGRTAVTEYFVLERFSAYDVRAVSTQDRKDPSDPRPHGLPGPPDRRRPNVRRGERGEAADRSTAHRRGNGHEPSGPSRRVPRVCPSRYGESDAF